MSALRALLAGRDRITNPSNWRQGSCEYDESRVCALNALPARGFSEAAFALADSARALFPSVNNASLDKTLGGVAIVALINDTLGHDAVMRIYDYAIEREHLREH